MRRTLALVAAGALVLAALAAAGRAERARWIESQRDGIHGVLEDVGGRYLTRSVSDTFDDVWRPGVSCVRYAEGGDPYAMQLCFDPRGRVIEAYDERSGKVVIHDLHVEPEESRLRIDLDHLADIKRYVRETQDEIRRAAEREALRQAQEKARADRK